jgi:hypothetical protein
MTDQYDIKSTIIYALGVAIENEDDEKVKAQLEDLEQSVTDGLVRCNKAPVIPRAQRYPVLTLSIDDATRIDDYYRDMDDNDDPDHYANLFKSLNEVQRQMLADYIAEWMYDGDRWEEALTCGLEDIHKDAQTEAA